MVTARHLESDGGIFTRVIIRRFAVVEGNSLGLASAMAGPSAGLGSPRRIARRSKGLSSGE